MRLRVIMVLPRNASAAFALTVTCLGLALRAEHDGDCVEKLAGQDHLVCRSPKFLEMRRFQMRRVSGRIGIHFKNSDAVGVVFLINGIQHQNPGSERTAACTPSVTAALKASS